MIHTQWRRFWPLVLLVAALSGALALLWTAYRLMEEDNEVYQEQAEHQAEIIHELRTALREARKGAV